MRRCASPPGCSALTSPPAAAHDRPLPASDGAFNAAVSSLVLCSVPDQDAALGELRRVLRPGGRLFSWEHVRAGGRAAARMQYALDATVWPIFGGGCHTARDTAAAIQRVGFTLERIERFPFPDVSFPIPTKPQILGTAIRAWRRRRRCPRRRGGRPGTGSTARTRSTGCVRQGRAGRRPHPR
ncbi:class I SAM-dependent methyltransferase [Geodermatophilus chilensis]|uniref:class I SAM-dependent methyltransferase n=1 Tax=Geodermatophilus chilensis TaxID=2035835 RepID=UPI0038CC13CA